MARSIYAYQKDPVADIPEDEKEQATHMDECLTYMDIAIKKVNRSSAGSRLFKRTSSDLPPLIDTNTMLSSPAFAYHRDLLGRRNSVCSTEPMINKVVKNTVTQIITAKKLEMYGFV